MKNIIKTAVSLLAVIILVVTGLMGLSSLTERKESRNKFTGFYEQEADFDVLFLGSSHMLNGIFPQKLWKDFGIVSYNLAGHGNRMPLTYWVLKNALRHTRPRLVVVDCYMVGRDDKIESVEQLHISTDHIPYSQTKVDMINDLLEEEERRMDFLWEFSTYHHRWNELVEEDFKENISVEKGAQSMINVALPSETVWLEEGDVLEEETLGMRYLYQILEECEEVGIQVLLTYLPFPDSTGWQKESNTVKLIAEEYGVDFLDYHTLWEELNPRTDFFDKDSHMNPSGAGKITKYLGEYIRDNYGIKDQRENGDYESWHQEYEEYYQFKLENLENEEELKNCLMLLQDEEISYGIYLKPWNSISSYPVVMELLGEMGIDYEELPTEDYFMVRDRVNQKDTVLKLFETADTAFGEFHMFYNDDGHLELTSSRADSMIITYSDIALVIFDNESLETAAQKSFNLKDMEIEIMAD